MDTRYNNIDSNSAEGQRSLTSAFRVEDLSTLIRQKRQREKLTLEQAAKDSGVSAATLSRWERRSGDGTDSTGPNEPDVRTLTLITRWLGVSIDRVFGDRPGSPQVPDSNELASVPDIVEAHLRADRNLDERSAEALSEVFRLAYDQFSRLSNTSNVQDRSIQSGDLKDDE